MAELKLYYPEMNEARPEAEIEAKLSYNGKYWYVKSKHPMKTSRSVKFIEQIEADNLTAAGQYLAGWYKYRFTQKAFDDLDALVAVETLLR